MRGDARIESRGPLYQLHGLLAKAPHPVAAGGGGVDQGRAPNEEEGTDGKLERNTRRKNKKESQMVKKKKKKKKKLQENNQTGCGPFRVGSHLGTHVYLCWGLVPFLLVFHELGLSQIEEPSK